MKKDIMIENWAHMLDEAFDKRSDKEKKFPRNENEKFVLKDVFTDELVNDKDFYEKATEIIDMIYPKSWHYFVKSLDNDIEVEGTQRDVDDWDVWKITPNQLFGSEEMWNDMLDEIADANPNGLFKADEIVTMKDILDRAIQHFYEKLENHDGYDFRDVEENGRCVHKATMHFGGHYPG